MTVTLKDLALRAGVHPSTISRLANGDPRARVSPETRARVLTLLKETGYRPDYAGRSLRLKQSLVLAVIIPDITNPLFAEIFVGVEEVATEAGYSVILANTGGSREREQTHLRQLQARRADGMILASVILRDPSVRWLRTHGIKHVVVDRFSGKADPFVGGDDLAGAFMATNHLIELGHRRIAHLAGPQNVSTAVLRKRGYLAALKGADIEPDPALIVEAGFLEEAGGRAMEQLLTLAPPPTAVFAGNDMSAIGAHGVAREHGLDIPSDVAIVGYDDVPLASRLEPPLTTIRVPVCEFGRISARMLHEQIKEVKADPRQIVLPTELMVRGSTAIQATRR